MAAEQCESLLEFCVPFCEMGESCGVDECAGGALLVCEEDVPEDSDVSDVCMGGACGVDEDLAQDCQDLLDLCLVHCSMEICGEDECIGIAHFKCHEADLF